MCSKRCSGLELFWMFLVVSATLFGVLIYSVQALVYIEDFTVSPREVGPGASCMLRRSGVFPSLVSLSQDVPPQSLRLPVLLVRTLQLRPSSELVTNS